MQSRGRVRRIGILLLPRFPLLAFSAAIVALQEANRYAEHELYKTRTLSFDGAPVNSDRGVSIIPDCDMRGANELDVALICAGLDPKRYATAAILGWIRFQARAGVVVGAICTGTYVLAKAGLLDGYRCTIHWENAAGFAEEFPDIELRNSLFEIDRNRLTCAGGTSTMDMMLNVIARDHGPDLAIAISHQFQIDRIRTSGDVQDPIEFFLQQTESRTLAKACQFMTSQSNAPISPREVADHVGVSQRQLERLFQKFLGRTPKRYLTELRLRRARELLLAADLSIVEVALASGFGSRSNFHATYRRFFGRSPGEERRTATRFETNG